MPTANKSCMCPLCGFRIEKGDEITFEKYVTRPKRRFGSGRAYGGGEVKWRPIHAPGGCTLRPVDDRQAQALGWPERY